MTETKNNPVDVRPCLYDDFGKRLLLVICRDAGNRERSVPMAGDPRNALF